MTIKLTSDHFLLISKDVNSTKRCTPNETAVYTRVEQNLNFIQEYIDRKELCFISDHDELID